MDVLNNENQELEQELQESNQPQESNQLQESNQPQDLFENKLPLSFPETDYKKDGKLKKVRGRVVKKLLKYEFRAYAPVFYILLAVLSALTLLVCLFIRFDVGSGSDAPIELARAVSVFMSMGFMLYIFTLVFSPVVIYGLSVGRYNNNFFKDEGYLTFSIPASMEEHVLSKHICGIVLTLVSALASFISLILFLSVSFQTIPHLMPSVKTNFFLELENILLALSSFIASFFTIGALHCWSQKFVKKREIFFRFLIFYFALVLLESVFTLFDFTAVGSFFASKAGMHVANWLGIIFSVGVAYLCYRYEVKVLKTRLNLK